MVLLEVLDRFLIFLQINAIMEVPTKVAVQYNHRSVHTPDNNAGASERAGFIDAPAVKAKTKYLIQQYLR